MVVLVFVALYDVGVVGVIVVVGGGVGLSVVCGVVSNCIDVVVVV